MPVSVTSNRSCPPSSSSAATRTATSPGLGELDGVSGKIDQHLPQAHRIAAHAGRHGGFDRALELQALRERARREDLDGLLDGVAQAEFDAFELELARLDLGEVQNVVDDLQQRFGRAGNRFRKMPLARSSSVACRSSDMPMTPFIGVRISWLMRARNSLLALLARSAASLARFASAIASLSSRFALPKLMVRSSTCCSRN